jgi:hypothetical protein
MQCGERERERRERERERERGDGWSALIHELMRNIRWRNIGPPHLIPHRSLFWEQLCSTPGASLNSRLSLSLCERQSERTIITLLSVVPVPLPVY